MKDCERAELLEDLDGEIWRLIAQITNDMKTNILRLTELEMFMEKLWRMRLLK